MKRKSLAMVLAATAVLSAAITGCGSSANTSAKSEAVEEKVEETTVESATEAAADDAAAAAPGENAGFTEYPIFEDQEVGFINLSAVYFQPVPMTGGYESIDGYDIHLEADISALQNDLGFGVGDWVPYLKVSYKVEAQDGKVAAEGTFMPMSASDGPHYGANIALPEAGTYNVTITIAPDENGYVIHTDSETGPGGTFAEAFADGALTYTFEGWDYTPQEW